MAASAPKFPAIPQPTADVNSLFAAVSALKQIVETLLGQRGLVAIGQPGTATVQQKNNAVVLWQDLVNNAIVPQTAVPGPT